MGPDMARRRKKSLHTRLQRVLRTLLLNMAITISAIATILILIKFVLVPALNDVIGNIATSGQKAIQEIQHNQQKSTQDNDAK